MNIKRLFLVGLTALSLTSCNLDNSIVGGNSNDLKLLRIETADENDEIPYVKSAKRNRKNAKKEIDKTNVTLTAVVKNESRASFIDLVVYNSATNKTVVFNEGNGQYQCKSETEFIDDMWVTNIEFEVNANYEHDDDFTNDAFYIEIKEIKFLKNSVDTKVDLNTQDIHRMDFDFSDNFYSRFVEFEDKDDDLLEIIEAYKVDVVNKKASLSVLFEVNYGDGEDYLKSTDIIEIPEQVKLKYIENKELKEGLFDITGLTCKGLKSKKDGSEIGGGKFTKLIISDKLDHLYLDVYPITIEYKEGSKVCTMYSSANLIIPSTCEELKVDELTGDVEYNEISYNGTKEEWEKIKGTIEYMEVKPSPIKFNDGSYINEKNEYVGEDNEIIVENAIAAYFSSNHLSSLNGENIIDVYKDSQIETTLKVYTKNLSNEDGTIKFSGNTDDVYMNIKSVDGYKIVKVEIQVNKIYDDLDFYSDSYDQSNKIVEKFEKVNTGYTGEYVLSTKTDSLIILNNTSYDVGINSIIVYLSNV